MKRWEKIDMSFSALQGLVSNDSRVWQTGGMLNASIFSVVLMFGLGVMFFSVGPARAFHTSPKCAGSFGYGSDGKLHCDVAQFNAAKKSGKKYIYDPSTAGRHKESEK